MLCEYNITKISNKERKTNNEKNLTLVIVLAMILTLSVNVFAEPTIIGGETGGALPADDPTIDVTVDVTTTTAATIYRVDIEWENLDFSYKFGNDGTWNPSTHQYESEVSDVWLKKDGGTVKVTNHSNASVTVSATAARAAEQTELELNFAKADEGESEVLAAGTIGGFNTADSIIYNCSVGGTLKAGTQDEDVIATITIGLE